jgi:hypothetical protein
MIAAIASERASRTSTQIRARCGWAPPQPRSVAAMHCGCLCAPPENEMLPGAGMRRAPRVLTPLFARRNPHRTACMPEKATIERARRDKRQGKSASTQAGEFVREEMHHIREGKHGAASARQAIAIGLSKARRAGVNLRPPAKGRTSEKTRRSAVSAYRKGQRRQPVSSRRSEARSKALRRESRSAASHRALSRQAHNAARRRGRSSRSAAARKAARTRARR